MTEYTETTFAIADDKSYTCSIKQPKQSNYTCYMFGNRPGGMGMVYTPAEGQVPNRFVRFMMRICLGCTWVKNK
jgi:hypothetical protein